MEIRKRVYICIDFMKYTVDEIKIDLKEESYPYEFHMGNALEYVDECDEFWVFGDVEEVEAYKKAIELGKDIWKMGD